MVLQWDRNPFESVRIRSNPFESVRADSADSNPRRFAADFQKSIGFETKIRRKCRGVGIRGIRSNGFERIQRIRQLIKMHFWSKVQYVMVITDCVINFQRPTCKLDDDDDSKMIDG